MTRKQNGTKRNGTKATETKPKPNVSHEIDLSEIKIALAKYIEDTRGTIMETTVIRIRGDKMIVAGNSQKK